MSLNTENRTSHNYTGHSREFSSSCLWNHNVTEAIIWRLDIYRDLYNHTAANDVLTRHCNSLMFKEWGLFKVQMEERNQPAEQSIVSCSKERIDRSQRSNTTNRTKLKFYSFQMALGHWKLGRKRHTWYSSFWKHSHVIISDRKKNRATSLEISPNVNSEEKFH